MNDLAAQVEQSIRRRHLFRHGQQILVAVSGGLDSMVLLRVLHELSSQRGWQLVVAHFNHQLRAANSEADAALVCRTAQHLGWTCVSERGDVRAWAQTRKLSIEMAARQLRHEFFARTARRLKINTVALAHHADDQVELFFLRLLRGAGCEGLAGMKWRSRSPADQRLWLNRPLLDQDKETLRAFAVREKVPFREDTTNAALDIQRNRVRHELLPLLRQNYQPALNGVILRLMDLLGETAEFMTEKVEQWHEKKLATPFAKLAPALQRAILQTQLFQLGLAVDYDRVELLRAASRQPVSVAPEVQAVRDAQGVVALQRSAPVSFRATELEIILGGKPPTALFGGATIHWRFLSGSALPRRRSGCEFFDADRVGPRIVLRHWQAGDRFQPIGLASAVKLQDWFTNRKLPRARRHELVLAATAAGEIFWVEGQRIGEGCKVGPNTTRRLRWHWKRT